MPESKDPKHYQKSIQTADAIMSQLSDEESIGYLRGAAPPAPFVVIGVAVIPVQDEPS